MWLIDGRLLVGHNVEALTPARTLQSLYIEPLLELASACNEEINDRYDNWTGIFSVNTKCSLQLLIDIKTDGEETWDEVVQALEPLRQKRFLSYYSKPDTNSDSTYSASQFVSPWIIDDKSLTKLGVQRSVITVVGTGNAPEKHIAAARYRDYFYDASIDVMYKSGFDISPAVSPIASGNWRNLKKEETLPDVLEHLQKSGIATRLWNTVSIRALSSLDLKLICLAQLARLQEKRYLERASGTWR